MTKKAIRMLAVGALVAFAGACDDSTGPGENPMLEQLVTAEVYSVVADGVSQDLDLMREFGPGGLFGFMGGQHHTSTADHGEPHGPGGPGDGPGGPGNGPEDGFAPDCPFDGTSYTCTRERMDELTMTRVITFRDVDGTPMELYDGLLTASVELTFDLEGTRSGDRMTAEIDRHREKVVTGMEGEEETRTWNGSGSDDVFRSMTTPDGAERTFDLESTTLGENVVMPVPSDESDAERWPLEGTITKSVEVTIVTAGVSETRTRNVTITFNGTQFAEIDIDGEKGTIDLAARRDNKRFKRHHGGGPGGPQG